MGVNKSSAPVPGGEGVATEQGNVFEPAPDAWERFEKAVDKVAKAPPQHRAAKSQQGRGAPVAPKRVKE